MQEQGCYNRDSCTHGGSNKGVPNPAVVDLPRDSLDFWWEIANSGHGMPDLIDYLGEGHDQQGFSSIEGEEGVKNGAYSPFLWYFTQSVRQANAKHCLQDSGCDGDAVDAAHRADEIDGRCGDGVVCGYVNELINPRYSSERLTCMLERRQTRK